MCRAVSLITQVPTLHVPYTFSAHIARYQNSINRVVESISRSTPTFSKTPGGDTTSTHRIRMTPLALPMFGHGMHCERRVYIPHKVYLELSGHNGMCHYKEGDNLN